MYKNLLRSGLTALLLVSAVAIGSRSGLAQTNLNTAPASPPAQSGSNSYPGDDDSSAYKPKPVDCQELRNHSTPTVIDVTMTSGTATVDTGVCAQAIVDDGVYDADGDRWGKHHVTVAHSAKIAVYDWYVNVRFDGKGVVSYSAQDTYTPGENGDNTPTVRFTGQGSFSMDLASKLTDAGTPVAPDTVTDLPHNWLYINEGTGYEISNWTRVTVDTGTVAAHNVFRLHAMGDSVVTVDGCWEAAAGDTAKVTGSCTHLSQWDNTATVKPSAPPAPQIHADSN